jgi:hypothetical protein
MYQTLPQHEPTICDQTIKKYQVFFINPFEESLSPLNEVPSNSLKMGLVLILVNYYRIQWATQTGVKKLESSLDWPVIIIGSRGVYLSSLSP